MRRVILAAFSVFLLCCGAYGVELKPTIALSPDYQGPGSELVITWFPLSGKSYNIEAAAQLTGPWSSLNPQPLVAQQTVETYRDQTAEPIRFYRIRKLDTEPPEVPYLSPRDGAVAVGRREPLVVRLSDEAGIDPQSISFSVGAGAPIGIGDPRLIFSDDFLVYTPAADDSYGGYGETVTASLSVSDALGYRLENYTWSLELELEAVLGDNVVLVSETSPLTLVSVDGETYVFRYAGDSPGVSVGDILVSTDAANPYKRKVLSITDHPESKTVEFVTEQATLADVFTQGSFRIGNASAAPDALRLSAEVPSMSLIHVEKRLPLDGTVIYSDSRVTVQVVSGSIELIADVIVAAKWGWGSPPLKSFDFDVTGTLNFDATVRATVTADVQRDYSKTIATVHVPGPPVWLGPVPVWVELALTFDVGMSAELQARGEITAGISSSRTISLGATLRDADWSTYRAHSTWVTPVAPTWQIEGDVNLKAYVEPKLALSLESLIGPSLNLRPYLEFDGSFQANPYAYDWDLYAGLTSDLSIDLRFWGRDLAPRRLLDLREPLMHGEHPPTEPPPPTWSRTFGGEDIHDLAHSVQQTTDGGFIVAGYTWSFGAGIMPDLYLIKTDRNGKEEWSRTFGGAHWEEGYSVQETTDGGFIVAGETYSFGAGIMPDLYLIKTDRNGKEEWSRTFGGAEGDMAFSVQQTADGGFIVGGTTESFGAGETDVYLIKTDASGNEEWSRTFGGEDIHDVAYSVQQTTDGGFIVAGYTWSFGAGGGDVYLIKTDANGKEEWSRTFGGADSDGGWSVQQTTDGGFILAGHTGSFGAGDWDVYLIKTDANGKEEWSRTFGGAKSDFGWSVEQTTDGGFIVAGVTQTFAAGDYDVYLIKTDQKGKEEWSRTFGGKYDDYAHCVQQTSDGGFIVAGWTPSFSWTPGFGRDEDEVYLIKTDRFGNAPSVPGD